ncbi:Uncharacterized protein YjlB [Propionibacterium cyclohexanicum]|uniref:Uncharacterized protein YjlB n=1 Tax=Propionibacterium cyclohexanicum TaxID=64702 RepID=A0A1H9RJX5_9ACTN|nr:cupin domain-containing protein [Propionibacterium cyclohexanicum]SER72343.1 Uncharacterized protein YjlB [Propionibacterium cyclohexanicum]
MSEQTPQSRIVEPTKHVIADSPTNPGNSVPVLHYRQAVQSTGDLTVEFDQLFTRHRWLGAWTAQLYDVDHVHPDAFEVLGIVRGEGVVVCGGVPGTGIDVAPGDVLVIPAGVTHRSGAGPLTVVGAYFEDARPSTVKVAGSDTVMMAEQAANVPAPDMDPIFGDNGPLERIYA